SSTPPTGSASTFGYNQANRLTSYNSSTSYLYNGDGQRVSKTVSGTATAFVWDNVDSTPLLLAAGTTYYIYGPNGAPIEQVTGSGTQYFHQDGYGSTRLLTSSTGAVVASYTYDPYGNLKAQTGTVDTALRWNGQYQDSESGLYYLRARYYDPVTAQFINRDPIGQLTQQPYQYGHDSPLNESDPAGLGCGWTSPWDCASKVVDVVHVASEVVTTVAGACALVAAASVVGNAGVSEVCGTVAL